MEHLRRRKPTPSPRAIADERVATWSMPLATGRASMLWELRAIWSSKKLKESPRGCPPFFETNTLSTFFCRQQVGW